MGIGWLPWLESILIAEFIGVFAHDDRIIAGQVCPILIHPVTTLYKTPNVFIGAGYKSVNGAGHVINDLSHDTFVDSPRY